MLKKKLLDGELAVTDAQIKKYYDENKATMYKDSNGTILPLLKVKNQIVNSLRDKAYSSMIDQLVVKNAWQKGHLKDSHLERWCLDVETTLCRLFYSCIINAQKFV